MLIIAGAGSGKTQTLAHRVHPGHMLLLTFSRRAAQEMERRVERILTSRGVSQGLAAIGWSGTFHAIGARLLRDLAHSTRGRARRVSSRAVLGVPVARRESGRF